MNALYVNAKGREVFAHSYSGGQEYRKCRRAYKHHRVSGWVEKNRKASLEAGKVIESAIQFYHENGLKPDSCVEEAKRLWLKFSEVPMDYTDQEESWSVMYGVLSAWARLYEIKLPSIGIHNPKFQLNYEKPLWAGSPIKFTAYVDLLSTFEDGRRLITDIKTARNPLDVTDNLLSLDPQLRRYSWLAGIPDVSFLWFTKAKPTFKKGDLITILDGDDTGQELAVWKFIGDTESVVAGSAEFVRIMDEKLAEIKGKGSTEAKEKHVAECIRNGHLVQLPIDQITKCRLQFVEAKVPESEWEGIGQQIGYEAILIKDSYEKDFWPQDGEVRGPNAICRYCSFLGLCIGRPDMVEQKLVQIAPAQKEDDWLKELESMEEGE